MNADSAFTIRGASYPIGQKEFGARVAIDLDLEIGEGPELCIKYCSSGLNVDLPNSLHH